MYLILLRMTRLSKEPIQIISLQIPAVMIESTKSTFSGKNRKVWLQITSETWLHLKYSYLRLDYKAQSSFVCIRYWWVWKRLWPLLSHWYANRPSCSVSGSRLVCLLVFCLWAVYLFLKALFEHFQFLGLQEYRIRKLANSYWAGVWSIPV